MLGLLRCLLRLWLAASARNDSSLSLFLGVKKIVRLYKKVTRGEGDADPLRRTASPRTRNRIGNDYLTFVSVGDQAVFEVLKNVTDTLIAVRFVLFDAFKDEPVHGLRDLGIVGFGGSR